MSFGKALAGSGGVWRGPALALVLDGGVRRGPAGSGGLRRGPAGTAGGVRRGPARPAGWPGGVRRGPAGSGGVRRGSLARSGGLRRTPAGSGGVRRGPAGVVWRGLAMSRWGGLARIQRLAAGSGGGLHSGGVRRPRTWGPAKLSGVWRGPKRPQRVPAGVTAGFIDLLASPIFCVQDLDAYTSPRPTCSTSTRLMCTAEGSIKKSCRVDTSPGPPYIHSSTTQMRTQVQGWRMHKERPRRTPPDPAKRRRTPPDHAKPCPPDPAGARRSPPDPAGPRRTPPDPAEANRRRLLASWHVAAAAMSLQVFLQTCVGSCLLSSVGQSVRLLTSRAGVRASQGASYARNAVVHSTTMAQHDRILLRSKPAHLTVQSARTFTLWSSF